MRIQPQEVMSPIAIINRMIERGGRYNPRTRSYEYPKPKEVKSDAARIEKR